MTVPAGIPLTGRVDDVLAAEVIERLLGLFGHHAGARAAISRVVSECVADLTSSPPGALPELLERLAHQRLLDVAPDWPTDGP